MADSARAHAVRAEIFDSPLDVFEWPTFPECVRIEYYVGTF